MKLAPYGKHLYALQKKGLTPVNSINLFIGLSAWKKGQNFFQSYPLRTLVLPAWESPRIYYWPVRQCDILIFDTGFAEQDYIQELAICLYEHDAMIVRFISPDYKLTVYHKEL